MHSKTARIPYAVVALLLALTAVAASAAPSGADNSAKIYLGSDAPADKYPFMVALLENATGDDFQDQFCGGSLVGSEYVLTAAHCLFDTPEEATQVLIGIRDLSDHTKARQDARLIILHPDFDPETLRNDLALIVIDEQPGESPVGVVAPGQEALWEPGDPMTAIGWGRTTDQELPYPYILQQVSFPRIDDQTCASELDDPGTIDFVADVMFCAGETGGTEASPVKDVCEGDSGGPLLVPAPAKASADWLVAGLVSFGKGCGVAPSAYTRLATFTPWINEIVAGYFSDTYDSVHRLNIRRIKDAGITTGFPDRTYHPDDGVRRDQMATFLLKAIDLTPGGGSPFTDIAGNVHEPAIEAIFNAAITTGFEDSTYRPLLDVSRGQMATFLAKALDLPPADDGGFSDTAGTTHEDSINRLVAAKITAGFPDGTFRPNDLVTREQMATFLVNAGLA